MPVGHPFSSLPIPGPPTPLTVVDRIRAVEWNRRVPYQRDIGAALRQAREESYREGDFLRQVDDQSAVSCPDTLLAAQPDAGTHSVIDMTGVSAVPAAGAVAPLPDDDLRAWFGTLRPQSAAVERALGDGLSGFGHWHGAYTVGYAGEQPETIFFFGVSGD